MSLIKRRLSKENFFPTILGIFINPFYFARKGLSENIGELASHISGRVLDVGCGQKPYRKLFNVVEYIGIDIDQSGHDHKNEDIDVFYDGRVIPFSNEYFDSIISNQVLEHVFNPNEHLSEINRVLKFNGRFLLTVPFMWDEHEQPYDYARYSSFGLRFLLEQHGFLIIEQRKSVSDIRAIFQMINVYLFKKTLQIRKGYFRHIVTLIINAPVNLLGVLFGLIFPNNFDLYLDNVIIAKKKKEPSYV